MSMKRSDRRRMCIHLRPRLEHCDTITLLVFDNECHHYCNHLGCQHSLPTFQLFHGKKSCPKLIAHCLLNCTILSSCWRMAQMQIDLHMHISCFVNCKPKQGHCPSNHLRRVGIFIGTSRYLSNKYQLALSIPRLHVCTLSSKRRKAVWGLWAPLKYFWDLHSFVLPCTIFHLSFHL